MLTFYHDEDSLVFLFISRIEPSRQGLTAEGDSLRITWYRSRSGALGVSSSVLFGLEGCVQEKRKKSTLG